VLFPDPFSRHFAMWVTAQSQWVSATKIQGISTPSDFQDTSLWFLQGLTKTLLSGAFNNLWQTWITYNLFRTAWRCFSNRCCLFWTV